jgi:hypothetical protein
MSTGNDALNQLLVEKPDTRSALVMDRENIVVENRNVVQSAIKKFGEVIIVLISEQIFKQMLWFQFRAPRIKSRIFIK